MFFRDVFCVYLGKLSYRNILKECLKGAEAWKAGLFPLLSSFHKSLWFSFDLPFITSFILAFISVIIAKLFQDLFLCSIYLLDLDFFLFNPILTKGSYIFLKV